MYLICRTEENESSDDETEILYENPADTISDPFSQEIKTEPESDLQEDTNEQKDDINFLLNQFNNHEEEMEYSFVEESSEEENYFLKDSCDEKAPKKSSNHAIHKVRNLAGKSACKYCDTVFKTRELKNAHDCPYLHCDPNNFICRICKKELSKLTFSNHLHETSDCQYCSKNFINPRNLKSHIDRKHRNEKKLPALKKNYDHYVKWKEQQEETQVVAVVPKERRKYKRKVVRLECGENLIAKFNST